MTEQLYDAGATLTAELSDEQRIQLAELLTQGQLTAMDLAMVLLDQASSFSHGVDRNDGPTEPLADEQVEAVRPVYRDDTVFLQCCSVRRWIGHKAGCPEVA